MLCNKSMVTLEKIAAAVGGEDAEMPRRRCVSVVRFRNGRSAALRCGAAAHPCRAPSAPYRKRRARALLDNWEAALGKFVKIVPMDYRRALTEMRAERDSAKAAAAE